MSNRQILPSVADKSAVRIFFEKQGMNNSLVKKYIAGTNLRDALLVVKELQDQGFVSCFDLLGEIVLGPEDTEKSTQNYLELIRQASIFSPDATILIKLTALGIDIADNVAKENLRRLSEEARTRGNIFLRVDMERPSFVGRILQIVCEEHREYEYIGAVVHANLRRTDKDLPMLNGERIPVRLVKGSTSEPPSAAFTKNSDIDAAFRRHMFVLLEQGYQPSIGTDDEEILKVAMKFIRQHNMPVNLCEFEMLMGVRRDLQTGMYKEGFPVRVSVPYGSAWYPYFANRIAGRPMFGLFGKS
jgi:proline dehydrogenase